MSDTKLGQLLDSTAQRDAIHIAIAPVIAARTLLPGMHIGLTDGLATDGVEPLIGIVDPFLTQPVRKGERFYLCLYQQTVTGMRHHWQHPAFKDGDAAVARDPEGESWRWMQGYADSICRSVDYVLGRIRERDYIVADGVDQHGWEYDGGTEADFWRHAETLLGHKVAPGYIEDRPFSCSC